MQGRSFAEVFGALADGEDLVELRAKFAAKAFKRRQEAVLLALRQQGWPDAEIVAMDLATLDALAVRRPRLRGRSPAIASCCSAAGWRRSRTTARSARSRARR